MGTVKDFMVVKTQNPIGGLIFQLNNAVQNVEVPIDIHN
jgi:hypothetical protein